MSRPLRIQYPGAVYHVMNRGRVRRATFVDDADSGVPRAWVSAARNRRASGSALCDGESTAQKAGATGVGCRIARPTKHLTLTSNIQRGRAFSLGDLKLGNLGKSG